MMADVRALRGIRYNPGQHANLGRLIAPPYDTAEPDLDDAHSGRSTFNIAEIENVDLGSGNSHALAAARYRDWRDRGLLMQDAEPAIYVHDHSFRDGETLRQRRGMLARVRLEDWDRRIVLPHERTITGPRNERLARLRAVHANLSPLYLLYDDEHGELRDTLAAATLGETPVASGVDHLGGKHTLTRLSGDDVIAAVSRFFAGQQLFVADGHHRYEAALLYRDEQRQGDGDSEAPTEFVLAMLADINDPGVVVRPTHRLVRGLSTFDPVAFRRKLEALFLVEAANGPDEPGPWICDIVVGGEPQPWRVAARPGRPHWRHLPDDRSPAWRELSVAVADSVILDEMLGLGPGHMPNHVTFTHDDRVARQAVASGEAQLAIILSPPSLAALSRVAVAGDQLPPKSSYFDPKPPAGLVINDLNAG